MIKENAHCYLNLQNSLNNKKKIYSKIWKYLDNCTVISLRLNEYYQIVPSTLSWGLFENINLVIGE